MARTSERETIQTRPERRPYGSRVGFTFGPSTQFEIAGEVSLLAHEQLLVRVVPKQSAHPQLEAKSQHFDARVEAFATAGEAERAGLRFAQALLWAAISMRAPMRLEYRTPLPCEVYDRNRGGGIGFEGVAHVLVRNGPGILVEQLRPVFERDEEIDRRLLLSMELFAAARLEVTERARFIGLVSALEPLADAKQYDEPVLSFVREASELLAKTEGIAERDRNSLRGRLQFMRQESISRALTRLVEETLPGDDRVLEIVDDGYNVRSTILHSGSTEANLGEKSAEVEDALRKLYAARLGRPLFTPAVNA